MIDQMNARFFVAPGSTVLDIGGFRGDTAALYLGCGAARVHVFDPLPAHCRSISERFAGDQRVTVHEIGLGDVAGTFRLSVPATLTGSATFVSEFADRLDQDPDRASARGPRTSVAAQVKPLDTLGLEPASFWKIDAEGSELEVLMGARETLKRTPPAAMQVEMFDFDADRTRGTITILRRHFPHTWVAGIRENGDYVAYPLFDAPRHPRMTADLERAGTPIVCASMRSLESFGTHRGVNPEGIA